jgi:hypothetical protein
MQDAGCQIQNGRSPIQDARCQIPDARSRMKDTIRGYKNVNLFVIEGISIMLTCILFKRGIEERYIPGIGFFTTTHACAA